MSNLDFVSRGNDVVKKILINLIRRGVYKYSITRECYCTNIFDYCVYFKLKKNIDNIGVSHFELDHEEPIMYTELEGKININSNMSLLNGKKDCDKLINNIIEDEKLILNEFKWIALYPCSYTEKEYLLYVLKTVIECGLCVKGVMRTPHCSEIEFSIDTNNVHSIFNMIQKEYDDRIHHKETQISLSDRIKAIYVEDYETNVLLLYTN